MPEIAGEKFGHLRRDGRGFRIGDSRALLIRPDGSFYDFRDGRHGFGAMQLIKHLMDETDPQHVAEYARRWLAEHPVDGPLALTNDGSALDSKTAEETASTRHASMCGLTKHSRSRHAGRDLSGQPQPHARRRRLKQLRWLPDWRGTEGALVAAVTDDAGALVGLQMTYITLEGQKSEVEPKTAHLRRAARLEHAGRCPFWHSVRRSLDPLRRYRRRLVGADCRSWFRPCDPRCRPSRPDRADRNQRERGCCA